MTLLLPRYPTPEDPCLVVLSWDTGGTCGWAVHRAGLDALSVGGWTFARQGHMVWNYGEIKDRSEWYMVDQMIEMTREAWALCDFDNGDQFAVVNEDFQLRMYSADASLLSPVRINSAYRYALRGSGLPMFLQQPADAMKVVTDARLKLWNLWEDRPKNVIDGVPDHRRDAQRHGILLLRKYASDKKIRDAVHRAKVNTQVLDPPT